eukprot:CAMPEP_0181303314 /NCGR_PEP_ID=MMETSP1101-20121128/8485_1 /TAXON_ID=46948 /ORGANISM="Rhodomonas abbreviata, Strain Caron Lab Isolate" /LENGTH=101 /DNA_ID=CAMNT_0023408865 /DNA_START=63 /DNA_END=365 /DNA_ORIENTATION=+
MKTLLARRVTNNQVASGGMSVKMESLTFAKSFKKTTKLVTASETPAEDGERLLADIENALMKKSVSDVEYTKETSKHRASADLSMSVQLWRSEVDAAVGAW